MSFMHEGTEKQESMKTDVNITGHEENLFSFCPYVVLELICHLLPFRIVNEKQLFLVKQAGRTIYSQQESG